MEPNQQARGVSFKETSFIMVLMMTVGIMLLPLPTTMMDLLLAFSISISLILLILSVNVENPLQLSSFPSILLIGALLRLALNIASTRLILSKGDQGPDAVSRVIAAFADLVVGGNVVLGVIIFAILVTINFVVITKGSGRIAEVAARFTLDAMPGKQMSIDADLAAGLIKEEEAKERRKNLQLEANFFGAMDGASKFVRGDAIAGLIIVAVNIIGGLVIGTAQRTFRSVMLPRFIRCLPLVMVWYRRFLRFLHRSLRVLLQRVSPARRLSELRSQDSFSRRSVRCSSQPEPSARWGGTWYANHAVLCPRFHLGIWCLSGEGRGARGTG